MDRRVKYTRALLKEALIELLQEKHISKISVKALCEKPMLIAVPFIHTLAINLPF